MDEARTARVVRSLRTRHGWRQVDLAARAGVSPDMVGRIERGLLAAIPIGQLDRVVVALGGSLDLWLRWHGGDVGRVINERHAAMHEAIARWFARLDGWVAIHEVSFSIFGERGVIDVVAWHAATRTLLIIDLKTELIDVSGLLGQVDRYRRVAAAAVAARGWEPARVAVWVVVAPGRTNARRLADHATAIRAVLPDDGRAAAGWLSRPDRPFACLSFLPQHAVVPLLRSRVGRARVRRPIRDGDHARHVGPTRRDRPARGALAPDAAHTRHDDGNWQDRGAV